MSSTLDIFMTNNKKLKDRIVGYIISLLGGFVVFYYTFGMSGFPDVYYISGIKSLSVEIYTAFSLIVVILAIISLFLILSSFAGLFLSFIGFSDVEIGYFEDKDVSVFIVAKACLYNGGECSLGTDFLLVF